VIALSRYTVPSITLESAATPDGPPRPRATTARHPAATSRPAPRGARVLVLQAHLRPAPWVCRSLHAGGHRVIAGSDRRLVGVQLARCIEGRRLISSTSERSFVDEVSAAVREDDIDVILPLTESALARLLAEADADVAARVAGPTLDQYRLVSDKSRLGELAARAGSATLPGVIVDARGPIGALPDGPVVVKPLSSVTRLEGRTVYIRPRVAEHPSEVDRAVRDVLAATGSALVQPFVHGPRWHAHLWRSAAAEGGLAARVTRSWPPATGMTCASEVVDDEAGLVATGRRVLRDIDYRGVASADFIGLPDGGVALHDINPRLPFSVAEAVRGGMDTPRIAVEIALGREPDTEAQVAMPGRRYHWMAGELRWLLRPDGGRGQVMGDIGRAATGRQAVLDPVARESVLAGTFDLAETALRRVGRR
jgi:hypothetical protein